MQCNLFFCVLLCFLYLFITTVKGMRHSSTSSSLQYGRCIPHRDYKVECNRCWCNSEQIFVCSKMKCKDIPRQFWEKVKFTKPRQPKKARSFIALIGIPFLAAPLFHG